MIQDEVRKLVTNGAIEESISEYASARHCIRQTNGSTRIVQDYRGLNSLLKAQSGGLGEYCHYFG